MTIPSNISPPTTIRKSTMAFTSTKRWSSILRIRQVRMVLQMVLVGFAFGVLIQGPILMTNDMAYSSSSLTSTSTSSLQNLAASMQEASMTKEDFTMLQREKELQSSRFRLYGDQDHYIPNNNDDDDDDDNQLNEQEETVKDFEKQEKVVIAIKIHGEHDLTRLKQSLCLLTAAYNNRVNYDILLFITELFPRKDVKKLRRIVYPARLFIEKDKLTLQQHIDGLDQNQTASLQRRCNVTDTSQLEWSTQCCEEHEEAEVHDDTDEYYEEEVECMPLYYNWQAEFRSKWIWYSKTLSKYRYMMWWDSNVMTTKVWRQDPVAVLIRNKLKLLFDHHFPQQARTKSAKLQEKIQKVYNTNETLCQVKVVDGHLHPIRGYCKQVKISQVHAFFYILDLDFYRNDENLAWFDSMIDKDTAFTSRQSWDDDQLAVTVPAAMRAPNESWSMNDHGVQLDVFHNRFFDEKWRDGGYVQWYQNRSAIDFPESIATCQSLVVNSG